MTVNEILPSNAFVEIKKRETFLPYLAGASLVSNHINEQENRFVYVVLLDIFGLAFHYRTICVQVYSLLEHGISQHAATKKTRFSRGQ